MSTTVEPVEVEEALGEKNLICVMDETGDTKHMWDPANTDETEIARDLFNKFTKKGYTAYKTDRNGEKEEVMKDFDPKAARMVLHKQMVGG